MGTLDYAAPEQIRGERVDARADIYALGCVLFHLIAGRPPFRRDTGAATLYAHLHDPPPPRPATVGGARDALERGAMRNSAAALAELTSSPLTATREHHERLRAAAAAAHAWIETHLACHTVTSYTFDGDADPAQPW